MTAYQYCTKTPGSDWSEWQDISKQIYDGYLSDWGGEISPLGHARIRTAPDQTTDPISNERLLPCPFCGGKAHLKESVDQDGPYVWVECYCGVDAFYTSSSSSHGVQFRDKNLAIAAWNRRQSPAGVEVRRLLKKIADEADMANNVIALNRDGSGQGRVKVATSMHRIAADAKKALSSLSVKEPEGAEPVAWQHRGPRGGWITTDEETDYSERALYASPPPKAVTITDEMVERAAEAIAESWGETWCCDCSENRGLDCDCGSAMTDEREQYDERLSREDCRMASRAAITAALSSEAHNDWEGE
ncbi:Lar family restriction alleviation protein [Parvibaculum sp.]|uniref:Lar family restriction alleviation protein n=1 Tax=Parvibaculum sp. TaxID=2024848 RepID=UPI003C74DB75